MTSSPSSTLAFNNLNALLIQTWERNGAREAMDDGMEVVSYHTLMRRVMALSCFIDECAGEQRGPVLLYLPSGLWAVRCMLATWMTGRAGLPIEAVAEARRGPSEHPRGRFLEPDRPHLQQLEEKPSLLITLAPLARIAGDLLEQASLESCPVLYANDISRMMDIRHQEHIRARLQKDWLETRGSLDGALPALLTESREAGMDQPIVEHRSHAAVLREMQAHLSRLSEPAPKRFLAMTSIGKASTWTHSALPCLTLGGRMNFIRFFHPKHVLDVLQRDRIEHLWMSPRQYSAFAPTLAGNRPDWPVQYWADSAPPEETIREFEQASGSRLRWIDESRS